MFSLQQSSHSSRALLCLPAIQWSAVGYIGKCLSAESLFKSLGRWSMYSFKSCSAFIWPVTKVKCLIIGSKWMQRGIHHFEIQEDFWKHMCIYNTCMSQTLNDTILYLRAFCYPKSLWSNRGISLLHEGQQLEFIIHLRSSKQPQ